MRLELAERLICPSAHERTPLIVVAHATDGRALRHADVGCMHCHREARIVDGTLQFAASMPPAPALAAMAAPTEDTLLRLAALLGLDGAQHPVLLTAAFTAAALPLAERYDTVVAVMGATGPSPVGVGYVSGSADAVPFADATFHGAALDAATSPALAADVVRCVRMGGRIVGDAALAVPAGVQELARDREQWVGEVEAPAIVVPLRRA